MSPIPGEADIGTSITRRRSIRSRESMEKRMPFVKSGGCGCMTTMRLGKVERAAVNQKTSRIFVEMRKVINAMSLVQCFARQKVRLR